MAQAGGAIGLELGRGSVGGGGGLNSPGPGTWWLVRDLSFPTYPSQAGGKRVKKPGLKVQTCWEGFLLPPEWGRCTSPSLCWDQGEKGLPEAQSLVPLGSRKSAKAWGCRRKTRSLGPGRQGHVCLDVKSPLGSRSGRTRGGYQSSPRRASQERRADNPPVPVSEGEGPGLRWASAVTGQGL